MKLSVYQTRAALTDVVPGNTPRVHLLGLFGETGSLVSALKKHLREKESFVGYSASVTEEIGDCFWYLATLCKRWDISLASLGQHVVKDLGGKNVPSDPTLKQLQAFVRVAHHKERVDMSLCMYRLGAAAGRLLAERSRQPEGRRLALGQMLLCLTLASNLTRVSLEDAVQINERKNLSRWPGRNPTYPDLLDEESLPHERLPRQISMAFNQYKASGGKYVIQSWNGVHIGDRLTDNRKDPDGYRFHDVFHLSYAVHLGWSPVIRALLRVKRKSDRKLDENEDGARAILVEESVAAWIFSRSKPHFMKGHRSVEFSLLKAIQELVAGYEVSECEYWQWERAILDGFSIFRSLRDNEGGTVHADLSARTIKYSNT